MHICIVGRGRGEGFGVVLFYAATRTKQSVLWVSGGLCNTIKCTINDVFTDFSLSRIRHIEKANESNAIEVLMVTDELFRLV